MAETTGEGAEDILTEASTSPTFKQAMGNTENWITAYRHNLWGMKSGLEDRYNELSEGDVILFRTYRETSNKKEWGIIGYGVLAKKDKKEDLLWPDEFEDNVNRYPLIIPFKRAYWHGSVEEIEDIDQTQKSVAQIEREMDHLREGMLTLTEIEDTIGYELHDINLWNVKGENARRIIDLLHRADNERTGATRKGSSTESDSEDRSSKGDTSTIDVSEQAVDLRPPKRTDAKISRVVRNTSLAKEIKERYGNKCQLCGDIRKRSSNTAYAEAHHIQPLGASPPGPDSKENLLVLCPNHHSDFDYGMVKIDPETLKIHHDYDESVDGETLTLQEEHNLSKKYLEFHNSEISIL